VVVRSGDRKPVWVLVVRRFHTVSVIFGHWGSGSAGSASRCIRTRRASLTSPSPSGVAAPRPRFAFPLVPALGSTGSATDRPALFASVATTAGSDFPRSFIIGFRLSLPDADQ